MSISDKFTNDDPVGDYVVRLEIKPITVTNVWIDVSTTTCGSESCYDIEGSSHFLRFTRDPTAEYSETFTIEAETVSGQIAESNSNTIEVYEPYLTKNSADSYV